MVHKNELMFALVSALAALAALFALPSLVAKPKLLFGRSLSAIEPSLFPGIILSLVLLLSLLLVATTWRLTRHPAQSIDQADSDSSVANGSMYQKPWFTTALFFILLIGYGLLLKPAGFLLSSFIVISLTSLLLGNRNWIQIVLFALLSPVCLYLIATRAMLVSLPELNTIELLYARLLATLPAF